MITVVDQVSPWFTPSSTLAKMTHPQVGAQISSSGTGMAMSQPATRTGLRPKRSDRVPAKKLVAAFTMPNAAMNVSVDEKAVSPNSCSASSGRTVRSWPIIPPTRALTPTRRRNWLRFSLSPRRIGGEAGWTEVVVIEPWSPVVGGPGREPPRSPPRTTVAGPSFTKLTISGATTNDLRPDVQTVL